MIAHLQAELLQLAGRIVKVDQSAIEHRWWFGRALAAERSSAGRLPNGRVTEVVKTVAKRTGVTLDRREIRRRVQLASAYPTVEHLREAVRQYRTWSGLIAHNFPTVDVPLRLVDAGGPNAVPLPGLSLAGHDPLAAWRDGLCDHPTVVRIPDE